MESGSPDLTDGVIRLRNPVDADAPALCAAVLSSLPELTPFMTSGGIADSLDQLGE